MSMGKRYRFLKLTNLENDNGEQNTACIVDLEPGENHKDTGELSDHVVEDDRSGHRPAAVQEVVDVLKLIIPLDDHSYTVLEKCR